ncbi:abortive infection family protein [Phaeobacter inhibens]|uniref:abortive infection family protein n=1 Tax=Phaeobacter inhibens TaxID=221822 RepID=UPI0026E16A0E|nr:abortive infection family protein [Phaeobacter inhibens]MDO6758103.1 abortive infection family protein [Phaeobacter inhibens]
MKNQKIPDHIADDDGLFGRFKIALSEALAVSMDESEWKKFAVRYGLRDRIIGHERFIRSLQWGDADHEGHVLDLIEQMSYSNVPAFLDLVERPNVKRALKRKDPEIFDIWQHDVDPVVTALSHSLGEVAAVSSVIDLKTHIERIEKALPDDPYLAVGATKDLLEAAMRTILTNRGHTDVRKLHFPELTSTCFNELGLSPQTPPASKGEGHIRKISSNARKMIETANELRNLTGTGHGHVVGTEEELSVEDASLVASNGLILAAWILKKAAP